MGRVEGSVEEMPVSVTLYPRAGGHSRASVGSPGCKRKKAGGVMMQQHPGKGGLEN